MADRYGGETFEQKAGMFLHPYAWWLPEEVGFLALVWRQGNDDGDTKYAMIPGMGRKEAKIIIWAGRWWGQC